MICHEVQPQLSAFLEKSLDAIRTKSIETHLNSCPACRAEANGLADCIRQVAELPRVEPPAGFARRVMAHVRELEAEPRGWQRLVAALRANMPIQAAGVITIAVFAVLLYQKEISLTQSNQSNPGQLTESRPASPMALEQNATSATSKAQSRVASRAVSAEAQRESSSGAEQDNTRVRQEQFAGALSTKKDEAAAPAASTETENPSEVRIAAPRRPTIQAQEVATGRGSFRPSADAFGFGASIGALSQAPLRNAPLARAERGFSPLSEPMADIELIVRRRPFERHDQRHANEEASRPPRTRSETDAAMAAAAAKRTVPAPSSPTSSIVEMRWFGVPADRYEQFRKELAAEARIDSEKSSSGVDNELSSQSSRELLIKVIILPSEP